MDSYGVEIEHGFCNNPNCPNWGDAASPPCTLIDEKLARGLRRAEANNRRQALTSRRIKAEKKFRKAQKVKAKEEFDRKFRPAGVAEEVAESSPVPGMDTVTISAVNLPPFVLWTDGVRLHYDLLDAGRHEVYGCSRAITFMARPLGSSLTLKCLTADFMDGHKLGAALHVRFEGDRAPYKNH